MNEFAGVTPPPRDRESEISRLNRWKETGFNEAAVAGYGGSVSLVKNILRSGQIHSYPTDSMLDYQRQLTEGGKHLYYALPFVDRFDSVNPEFASAIREENVGDWIVGGTPFSLMPDQQRLFLAGHARRHSLMELLRERTDLPIEPEEVLGLAREVIPQKFYEYQEAVDGEIWAEHEDDLEVNQRPEIMAQVRSRVPQEELSRLLEESLNRRGVILYFGRDMFTNAKLHTGVEDETEIMVVTEQPLSIDVISGIEVPSEADRQALGI